MLRSSNVFGALIGTSRMAQPSGLSVRGKFPHRLLVVGDMLENVAAQDDIEAVVRKLAVANIDLDINGGIGEIRCDIMQPRLLAKDRGQAWFGRHVQHFARPGVGEEVRLALQKKISQPVPLIRVTIGAPRVISIQAQLLPSHRQKPRGRTLANRAVPFRSSIIKMVDRLPLELSGPSRNPAFDPLHAPAF